MSFYNPTYLLLLAIVPVVFIAAWVRAAIRVRARTKFAHPGLFEKIADIEPMSRIHGRTFLTAIALILIIVALARPQGGEKILEEEVEGIEIMLVLDISKSMNVTDLYPDRLTAIKNAVATLIGESYGDRIGLIAFAGVPIVVCPLTTDHGSLQTFIDNLDTDIEIRPGTGIGNAISMAVSRFRKDEGSGHVIILFTDGENNKGMDPMDAVEEAKEAGIRIYTVGIGTPEGAPLPEDEQPRIGRTRYRRDDEGNQIMVRLDEDTLIDIASETGGKYFCVSKNSEVRKLFSSIEREGETEFQIRRYVRRDELAPYFLFAAALFLIFEALYSYITVAENRRTRVVP